MRKFLIGCGVVLGLLLLMGLIGSWFLMSQLKKELPNLKQLENQQEELLARFGPADEFTPSLDNGIDPTRMELYLSIREALPHDGTRFSDAIQDVSDQEKRLKDAKGLSKVKEAFRIAQEGMGVARVAMEVLAQRDSVLLAEGMGPGEYIYYTVLGPVIALDYQPEPCTPELEDSLDPEDLEAMESAQLTIMGTFREQLANARRELSALPQRSVEQDDWLLALEDELDHGRIGGRSVPFADGLPVATVEALAPYLDQLRASLPRCREAWSLELLVAADDDDDGFNVMINRGDDD